MWAASLRLGRAAQRLRWSGTHSHVAGQSSQSLLRARWLSSSAAGISYLKGPTTPPLLEKTIGQAFWETVEKHPSQPCVVSREQGVRFSWEEFAKVAVETAVSLVRLGLKPGERVGIWAPNCWQWLATQYATALTGNILVNINPGYRPDELEYTLNKVECSALVMAQRVAKNDFVSTITSLAPEIQSMGAGQTGSLSSKRLPHLRAVVLIADDTDLALPGMQNFSTLVGSDPTKAERDHLDQLLKQQDNNDAINIQFTSGTTGSPKGATLSHRNILNNGHITGETLHYTEKDKICVPVPMYHCFGMVLGALAALTHGSAMVYPSAVFNPTAALATVAEERCTSLYGVPTMFIAELNDPTFGEHDLSSLRTGVMAGSPCPEEVMRKVMTKMHMNEVTIGYGMTETSPISFQSHVDDPIDRRVSSVGRVHPHVEVRVADPETNEPLPIGTPGELQTRGYSVMKGYWNDQEKTAADTCPDGFFKTGDMAVFDDEGFCEIVGRYKDMIIRGGENIYPVEIEEYLYRHQAVQNVQVVGVPDDYYGEQVVACVIASPGTSEDELKQFCKGGLAHYKIPWRVLFVNEFPLTVTGKVQKFKLRETVSEQLGLNKK